jgi:hypothetical protein
MLLQKYYNKDGVCCVAQTIGESEESFNFRVEISKAEEDYINQKLNFIDWLKTQPLSRQFLFQRPTKMSFRSKVNEAKIS